MWYVNNKKTTNTIGAIEVMSFSNTGLGGLSNTLQKAFRQRLLRKVYSQDKRKVYSWDGQTDGL